MKKIYAISGSIFGALILFLWLILPSFFNTDEIKNDFITTIQNETNIQAEIRGDISLSVFPFGNLSAEDIAFSKNNERIGTADKIEVGFSFIDAITGNITPNSIKIINPEIKEDLDLNSTQSFSGIHKIVVKNGSYNGITKIELEAEIEDKIAEGEFLHKGKTVEFSVALSGKNTLTAQIKHKLALIYYDGNYNFHKGNLRLDGEAEIRFNNLNEISNIILKNNDAFDRYKLPNKLTLKGNIRYYKERFVLNEFYGDFGESRIGLSIDYPLKNRDLNATAFSLAIDSLNLDTIIQNGDEKESLALKLQALEIPKKTLIYADFSINNLIYNGKSINIKKLRADIIDGGVTLQPSIITFSGNNTATFFGVFGSGSTVDWDKKNNRRFAGEIEFAGENLKEMLLVAGFESFKNVPESALKKFNLSADLFITKDELRLADVKGKIDDTSLIGVLIADFKNGGIFDSTISIENTTFSDYFPTNLRFFKPDVEKEKKHEFLEPFSWIEDINLNVKLNFKAKNSRFWDRKFDAITFNLISQKGELKFEKINVLSDDLNITGNGEISIARGIPNIKTELKFGKLNLDNFFDIKKNDMPFIGDKKWSTEPFDFYGLSQFNTEFNLETPSLKYNDYIVENLRFKGELRNKKLDITEATGEIWNGRFAIATSLISGKVSSVSSSFTLHNMNVWPILNNLFGVKNITGVGSINGKLQTSGVNPYSWISQISGAAYVTVRPLVLKGFSLSAIVSKISRLRSVADIINISRLAFKSGKTYFEHLSGRITVQNGKLLTILPMDLVSKSSNGNTLVELNLVDGQADILSQFSLNVLSCDIPAILKIRQKGLLKKMKKVVDTKLLEDYVAKCSANRMLNR